MYNSVFKQKPCHTVKRCVNFSNFSFENFILFVDKHVITCYNIFEVKERRYIRCGNNKESARNSKGLA